jgi:hypothetical protein
VGGSTTPLAEGAVSVLTKTIPPGSYMVWAKAQLLAEASKAEFSKSFCELAENPGTTATKTGEANPPTVLDIAGWDTELGEESTGEFTTENSLAMQGDFASSVTSTLSVVCSDFKAEPELKVPLLVQMHALGVTSIG